MFILIRIGIDKNSRTTVLQEVRKLFELDNGDAIERIYKDGHVYVRKSSR